MEHVKTSNTLFSGRNFDSHWKFSWKTILDISKWLTKKKQDKEIEFNFLKLKILIKFLSVGIVRNACGTEQIMVFIVRK